MAKCSVLYIGAGRGTGRGCAESGVARRRDLEEAVVGSDHDGEQGAVSDVG